MTDEADRSEDLGTTLRSQKGELEYFRARQAGKTRTLVDMPTLREWEHWRLVANDFPYDIAFKTHHMLVIKRSGLAERFDLNPDELREFDEILRDFVYPNYSLWFENVPANRTIPTLYHVHLVKYHDSRADMRL